MTRSILRVVAALAGFALIHSFLASRTAKEGAARLFGRRARNALYRPFYLAQSVLTLGAMILFIRRLPDRTLYSVPAPWARLLNAGQAAAGLFAVYTAAQIGFSRVLGVAGLLAWLRGDPLVPPEPEAQGPALRPDGSLRVTGPFAWSRHPLNFAPLPIFWLAPTMTLKLLALNVLGTIYLVVGSAHEEARLGAAYGPVYEAYRHGDTPFYVPGAPAVEPAPHP